MSAFLDSIVERARKLQKRIVFPEGDDPRVREASARSPPTASSSRSSSARIRSARLG
ncbi:MAG: phosphate acyltransferase [Bryobacterales bacterium]